MISRSGVHVTELRNALSPWLEIILSSGYESHSSTQHTSGIELEVWWTGKSLSAFDTPHLAQVTFDIGPISGRSAAETVLFSIFYLTLQMGGSFMILNMYI